MLDPVLLMSPFPQVCHTAVRGHPLGQAKLKNETSGGKTKIQVIGLFYLVIFLGWAHGHSQKRYASSVRVGGDGLCVLENEQFLPQLMWNDNKDTPRILRNPDGREALG